MPILKSEPDRFPADVFELAREDHPWSVAHVRSRQEKALARELAQSNVPFYLPQAERRIRRSGRTFVSHHPLFGGYVFLRANRSQFDRAFRTNAVVRIIQVTDQETLHRELAQLSELQRLGAGLFPHPHIETGDAVRVTEGVFTGFTGVVLRRNGAFRLVVSVSFLRQSIAVDFDREVLVPLGKSVAVAFRSGRVPV